MYTQRFCKDVNHGWDKWDGPSACSILSCITVYVYFGLAVSLCCEMVNCAAMQIYDIQRLSTEVRAGQVGLSVLLPVAPMCCMIGLGLYGYRTTSPICFFGPVSLVGDDDTYTFYIPITIVASITFLSAAATKVSTYMGVVL